MGFGDLLVCRVRLCASARQYNKTLKDVNFIYETINEGQGIEHRA